MTPTPGRRSASDSGAQRAAERHPEAGITLVEMLVALALLAVIGVASFALLDTVIGARDGVEGRLDDIAERDRALLLFGRDLLQSRAGSQRLEGGRLSFAQEHEGEMSYEVGPGGLERIRGTSLVQLLVPGLAGGGFRLLDAEGTWHDAWPPDTDTTPPPVAVEMQLVLATDPPSTMRRLVPLALPADAPTPDALVPVEEAADETADAVAP